MSSAFTCWQNFICKWHCSDISSYLVVSYEETEASICTGGLQEEIFRFRTICKIKKNLEKNEQEGSSKHQAKPRHLRTLQASVRCPAISISWEFLLLVDCHHHCWRAWGGSFPYFVPHSQAFSFCWAAQYSTTLPKKKLKLVSAPADARWRRAQAHLPAEASAHRFASPALGWNAPKEEQARQLQDT